MADTVKKNNEEVVPEVDEVTDVAEVSDETEAEEVATADAEETAEVEAETDVEVTAEVDSDEEEADETDEEAVAEVDTNEDTSNAEAATPGFDEAKFQEFLDQLREAFFAQAEESKKSADAHLATIAKSIETLTTIVVGLKGSQDEAAKKVADVESKMNETKERLDVVAGDVSEKLAEPAVKKSLDSVHEKETATKSREESLFEGFFSAGIPGWDD